MRRIPLLAMVVAMVLSIIMVAALASCASTDEPGKPTGPTAAAYTAEPVEDLRYSSLLEWRPMDRNSVLLRFDGNRYYLIELREPCVGHPREADSLALAPAFSGRLRVNDRIELDGRGCIIESMSPLDYAAYREARSGR